MTPKEKILARLKQLRAEQLGGELQKQMESKHIPLAPIKVDTGLNEQQQQAVTLARSGQSFCLIGPAGSGKTYTFKAIMTEIMTKFGISNSTDPGKIITVLCYTRRASRNAAKALKDINAERQAMTAHKFLEYRPEKVEYVDENGDTKETMRFLPFRDADNPITEAQVVTIDEAGMLDAHVLYAQLEEAAPNAIFIFVGDLNQIPPVFGDSILGHALTQLPVVELTQVYRQAMESPILRFVHNILLPQKLCTEKELQEYTDCATVDTGLEFISFKKEYDDGKIMAKAFCQYIMKKLDANEYAPELDTILVPYNKAFGSIEINTEIAQELGTRRGAIVHEILAGREKKYFAIGDNVMFEKSECEIVDIKPNPKYIGATPQTASATLKRNGLDLCASTVDAFTALAQQADRLLDSWDTEDKEAETRQASHIISLVDIDTGREFSASSVGDISPMDFSYAMTVHKSQGSQWRKVWLIITNHHSSMLSKEIFYTGMTRAQDKCTVIYSASTRPGKNDHSVNKCIKRARIPGKTWQEKAAFFAGREPYMIRQSGGNNE